MRVSRLIVLLVFLTACSAPVTPAAPAAPGTDRADNQRLIWGANSIASSIDPAVASGRYLDIFETLTMPSDDGTRVEPLLATSWKAIDATTWEFSLRPGSVFHNGDKVTAADVKFSIDRYLDPATKSFVASRLITIKEAIVVDDATVRVVTKAADPILVRRLFDAAVMPAKYFQSFGDPAEFGQKPVGSGPWKVKEIVTNDHLTLVPFTEHPTRKPIFSEVIIRAIPDLSARGAGLRTGDLDYIDSVSVEQAEQLKGQNFMIASTPAGNNIGCFTDSLLEGAPTRDKRVRQALQYAVDVESLSKVIFRGLMQPSQGQIVQPGTFGFNPNLKPYPYDPAKAKQLLADAGYTNGFKMVMEGGWPAEQRQMAEFLQSQYKAIGIDAEISTLDGTAWAQKFIGPLQRTFFSCQLIRVRPAMDADFAITWFRSDQTGSNGVGPKNYNNPAFDRLYAASTAEMDSAKREKLLQDALAILHDDPPYFSLIDQTFVVAQRPAITGIVQRVDGSPSLVKGYRTK